MFKIRMLLLSVLLSVFCCPLLSHAQLDEAEMMAMAKGHYQEGGYYYASTWLERILRTWPQTAQREEILLMMAKSYAATGREDKAARVVKTLMKDYPQAAAKLDPETLKLAEQQEPYDLASAQPDAAGQGVPDAARRDAPAEPAEPAAAKVQDEASAPVPAEAPKKAEGVKPAVAKVAAATVAEVAQPAVAEAAKPAAAAVAKPAPASAAPVAISVDAPKGAETETACRDNSATAPGSYAVEVGEFVGKNALIRGKRAVEKAGLVPVVGPGRQRVEAMLRILVGEYSGEAAAKKVLNKLRKVGAEHFMLKDNGGTFRVYAGSYFEHQAALDEQKRLLGKGFDSELREATVPVSTYVINAGCFPTEEAARGKLAELERLGVKGKVLPPQ
jgi:hypothetical protein